MTEQNEGIHTQKEKKKWIRDTQTHQLFHISFDNNKKLFEYLVIVQTHAAKYFTMEAKSFHSRRKKKLTRLQFVCMRIVNRNLWL